MQINAKPASEKVSSVTIDGVPHSKCKKVEVTPIAGMTDPAAEIEAMRAAIREADLALRKCLTYFLRLPTSGSDYECETMDDAHHALTKLKPFLTDATTTKP